MYCRSACFYILPLFFFLFWFLFMCSPLLLLCIYFFSCKECANIAIITVSWIWLVCYCYCCYGIIPGAICHGKWISKYSSPILFITVLFSLLLVNTQILFSMEPGQKKKKQKNEHLSVLWLPLHILLSLSFRSHFYFVFFFHIIYIVQYVLYILVYAQRIH